MEITIEKGVRMPGKKSNYGMDYPFDKMEVGDSFEISKGEVSLVGKQQQISANAKMYAFRHNLNWKFATRTFKEKGTVRIWRVK